MATVTTAIVQRKIGSPTTLETVRVGAIRPDEALVQMHASGICQTDNALLSGKVPFGEQPRILGHEGAGVVLDCGSEIKGLAKGDKVLLSFAHCQQCEQCKDDHPAYCEEFTPRNFSCKRPDQTTPFLNQHDDEPIYGHFFGQSSFAKTSAVHHSSLVKVPPDTDLALCAPLGCGIITGAGTVLNTINLKEGAEIVIFGCGGVGMAALMAAKLRKAGKIIAVDVVESRLKLAQELGATHVINGKDADVVEQVQKLCPPSGVKFAVEASGIPSVTETMIKCLGKRGKAVQVGGPPPDATAKVEVLAHVLGGREYIGVTEGDSIPGKLIPYLIEQQKLGNFPLEKLNTYYDAKDFQKALDDMLSGVSLKSVIKWT